jgi:hypothetical protein
MGGWERKNAFFGPRECNPDKKSLHLWLGKPIKHQLITKNNHEKDF